MAKIKQNAKSETQSPQTGNFLSEVKGELGRITWTDKEELFVYTKIVVIATLVFGLMIYLMDLGIRGGLNIVTSLLSLITG